MKIKLDGFKYGDDITIMNTMSRRGKLIKDRKGNDVYCEVLTLVYKDNRTGVKYKKEIIDPDYEYYITKDGCGTSYNRLFAPKDELETRIAPHRYLEREIARDLGKLKWYQDCISVGDRAETRKIHTHPNVFRSDTDIEDHYRFWFSKCYSNRTLPPTKAFFDIEVDGIDMAGDFPELGECPVNAISVIFQDKKHVYTLLLDEPRNPLINDFKKFIKENGTQDLHDFIYNYVVSQRSSTNSKNPSLGIEDFKFNIIFFDKDKELEMIKSFFKLINTYQPDFALAWNQAFDIPYLISRIRNLGGNSSEIMSHPDFEFKIGEYFVDERSANDYAERKDFALVSSYTCYLDQMIQFASRRKGQTAYVSYSLDFIGEEIADIHKLDYKSITTNIVELPYKDYKTFVYYNVMDTVVQYCIEQVVFDVDYVFEKAIVNNTKYAKVHRQTVYLANRGAKIFDDEGFIMGNNANKYNEKPTTKFPGAYVADPVKVSDYSRMSCNGYKVNLFNNTDDFDFKSLYPSDIRQFNIAAHTQIGLAIIRDQIHAKENKRHDPQYSRGGAFFEDLQSNNWIETCNRWFNAPSYMDMVEAIRRHYTNRAIPRKAIEEFNVNDRPENQLRSPIVYDGSYNPIIIKPEMDTRTQTWTKEYHDYVSEHPNQSF